MSGIEVTISDVDFPGRARGRPEADRAGAHAPGKIVTNDFNLNKVAQLRGVDVLNVNELANSLKPVVLPGEIMKVFILKEGKEYNQGVAYLDDGTMVVVDNARKMISKTIDIVVTSVLQTTAGKMIFGRHIESGIAATAAPVAAQEAREDNGRRARPSPSAAASDLTDRDACASPLPLVADGLLSDSGHHGLHRSCSAPRRSCRASFDRRGHFAHGCARAWSWLILKTTGVDVTVEGLARLTPGTTHIFVSNHQSHYDTPVVFSSLPYQLRIIAKESLARFPVLGWHLKRGGHLFVDRRDPDRAGILKRWRALVSDGLSLIVYAEGTRSGDGHVARFKAGSFLLAIQAGLPIVPLAIIGTRAVMPKGRLRTEPANVTLVIHDPIQPAAIAEPTVHDAKELAARVHEIVAAAVRRAVRGSLGRAGSGAACGPSRASRLRRFGWSGITWLNSVGSTLASVCRDVGGIQAQVMSAAELSLWTRRRSTRREDVQAALWQRRELVKTTSMRMTLHLLPARDFQMHIARDEGVVDGERASHC